MGRAETERHLFCLADVISEIKQKNPYLTFRGLREAFDRVRATPPDERITETKIRLFRGKGGDAVVKAMIPGYTFRFSAGSMEGVYSLLYTVCYEGEEVEEKLRAEEKAQDKLRTIISERQMQQYKLTATFCEKSSRSGLLYLFRRCFPTLVYKESNDGVRFLIGLCMHNEAHETHSWRGVLCPTDDVIAQVLFMRGDERKYWAKATHHTLESRLLGV